MLAGDRRPAARRAPSASARPATCATPAPTSRARARDLGFTPRTGLEAGLEAELAWVAERVPGRLACFPGRLGTDTGMYIGIGTLIIIIILLIILL